jgi:ribosome maturation factor RimP
MSVHRREGDLEASDEPEPLTGTLLAVDDDHVTLDTDGTEVTIAFTDLDHGKVVLPW